MADKGADGVVAVDEAGFGDVWGSLGDIATWGDRKFGSVLMGTGCKEDVIALAVNKAVEWAEADMMAGEGADSVVAADEEVFCVAAESAGPDDVATLMAFNVAAMLVGFEVAATLAGFEVVAMLAGLGVAAVGKG